MINRLQGDSGKERACSILGVLCAVTGQESTPVSRSLNQSMNGVTICLDGCEPNFAIFIRHAVWFLDDFRAIADGTVEDEVNIVDVKRDILRIVSGFQRDSSGDIPLTASPCAL